MHFAHRSVPVPVLAALGFVLGATPTRAGQVYSWKSWTVASDSLSATATLNSGTVTVTTLSPDTLSVFPVRFDNVPFTPTNAPGLGVHHTANLSLPWRFDFDFSGLNGDTNGVVVGIGNFGYTPPSYTTYKMSALDASGSPLDLRLLDRLGSYDDTWVAQGLHFDDDLSLTTATGALVVTRVPGQNEANSDMLLLQLPFGVGSFTVQTSLASSGDTVNVVIADTEQVWTPVCTSSGSFYPCPCNNRGVSGHGCENSSATGGAKLRAEGDLAADTAVLVATGQFGPSTASLFIQGTATFTPPVALGDGLRCVGGTLRLLYAKRGPNGTTYAPYAGDLGIRARSAYLGDPIPANGTRYYYVVYRDPSPTFCPSPAGAFLNVSNSIAITWP
jgi:hypothetical protein